MFWLHSSHQKLVVIWIKWLQPWQLTIQQLVWRALGMLFPSCFWTLFLLSMSIMQFEFCVSFFPSELVTPKVQVLYFGHSIGDWSDINVWLTFFLERTFLQTQSYCLVNVGFGSVSYLRLGWNGPWKSGHIKTFMCPVWISLDWPEIW